MPLQAFDKEFLGVLLQNEVHRVGNNPTEGYIVLEYEAYLDIFYYIAHTLQDSSLATHVMDADTVR